MPFHRLSLPSAVRADNMAAELVPLTQAEGRSSD
jgi:hypothetical protein